MTFPCVSCGKDSSVLDTRAVDTPDGFQVRRRRQCDVKRCGHRWSTIEVLAVREGKGKFLSAGGAKILTRINETVAKKLRNLANQVRAGKL